MKAPITSRTVAAALVADPKERDIGIRTELAALCRAAATLSMHYRTGGGVPVAACRSLLDHAHTLFGLAIAAQVAQANGAQ